MRYTCPVCGFSNLRQPPEDNNICPCCGTEFGYDDFSKSHQELRLAWLAKGAPWFSRHTPPPQNWNSIQQLLDAALIAPPTQFEYTAHPPTGYSSRAFRVNGVVMYGFRGRNQYVQAKRVISVRQATPQATRTSFRRVGGR